MPEHMLLIRFNARFCNIDDLKSLQNVYGHVFGDIETNNFPLFQSLAYIITEEDSSSSVPKEYAFYPN